MTINRRRRLGALATIASLASVSFLAACGDDDSGDSDSSGKVTITVEGWRPGDEQGTIDAVKKQADAFMKLHSDIVVEPVEWEWSAETFATQLAGDTLPTTFRVPFTDTKGLAERGQIADVTKYVDALPYAEGVQPQRAPGRTGHRRQDLRPPDRCLRRRPVLQPRAVRAGRPRPRLSSDHVGRGARGRQGHR